MGVNMITEVSSALRELAFNIAKARILLERGDIEGVQSLLDDAAGRIPSEVWPRAEELTDGE